MNLYLTKIRPSVLRTRHSVRERETGHIRLDVARVEHGREGCFVCVFVASWLCLQTFVHFHLGAKASNIFFINAESIICDLRLSAEAFDALLFAQRRLRKISRMARAKVAARDVPPCAKSPS